MITKGISIVIFSFSYPVIVVTMISHVDPLWYQVSRFIECGLGGAVSMWLGKRNLKQLRKYFATICISDCILTVACNFMFAHDPNYRFISMSLLNVLISSMMYRIIDDIINNISRGSELTILNNRREGYEQISIFLGSLMIVAMTYFKIDISCDLALTLQCLATIISCMSSIFITKKLIGWKD